MYVCIYTFKVTTYNKILFRTININKFIVFTIYFIFNKNNNVTNLKKIICINIK